MAGSSYPRYIQANFNVFVNGVSQIGQASGLELPELKSKVEEVRNAGMHGPIEVPLGYEKLEAKLKMTGLIPTTLGLFGITFGKRVPILATGAYVDHDGTVHQGIFTGNGLCKMIKIDELKSGDKKSEHSWEFACDDFKYEMDGQIIISVHPFDGIVANGAPDAVTTAINKALMVA